MTSARFFNSSPNGPDPANPILHGYRVEPSASTQQEARIRRGSPERTLRGAPSNLVPDRISKRLRLVAEERVDHKTCEQAAAPIQTDDVALPKNRFLYVAEVLYWDVKFLQGSVELQSLPFFDRYRIGIYRPHIAGKKTKHANDKN